MSESPEGRCGFVGDVTGVAGVGPACCWRETWRDRPRCVWHARGEKPAAELAADPPAPDERVDGATLHGVDLADADWLAGRSLVAADFTRSRLRRADLGDADLRRASFRRVDATGASFAGADLEDADFPGTDLRDADFTDARLYRATFSDARVDGATEFGAANPYERDLDAVDDPEAVRAIADLALWVYSEVSRVFEANAVPDRALDYYLRERDLRRRVAWRLRDYATALRLEGSRWVMRYGTSPWRVLGSSAVLLVGSALAFPLTGGLLQTGPEETIPVEFGETPLDWPGVVFKSLYFSAVTFATLGYGDIQPVGSVARLLAATESLLGTLLMALLVFVLTRRVG